MSSFLQSLRLFAYHYGLKIDPKHLIPPQRIYRPEPMKLAPIVKTDSSPSKNSLKTRKEIQVYDFLQLAKEEYSKEQTRQAQENLEKALLLATSNPEKDFSQDLLFEMYYLRGYIMLQKNKPRSAEINFKIFLRLKTLNRKPDSIKNAQARLEMIKIIMKRIKVKGIIEPFIEKLMNSLTDKTDPGQSFLRAQCYLVLSEYQYDIGDSDSAFANGKKSLEIFEGPELKDYSTPDLALRKLELSKILIKICRALVLSPYFQHWGLLPSVAKIIQELNSEEIDKYRKTFAYILPKLFEMSVKLERFRKRNYEVLQILREANLQESDFYSKDEYLENILNVVDGLFDFGEWIEGSKLLNGIPEDLSNDDSVSIQTLGSYYYLKSLDEYENRNYQQALYYKRLYQESKPEESSYFSWDFRGLTNYTLGIKANVKLNKLDEAIEEVPLYLKEAYRKMVNRGWLGDSWRIDLMGFLSKNMEDVRWEKWLRDIKAADMENRGLWYSKDRQNFVYMNLLVLCAKNKEFSLAENCAVILKNSQDDWVPVFDFTKPGVSYKKTDMIFYSSIVKECLEEIESLKGVQLKSYLISLTELIPVFNRRRYLRGSVFILEEIEKLIHIESLPFPLMIKLQTIKDTVYYDLKEWEFVIGFLAETISQIEKTEYQDEYVPVLYNVYGDALCKSGHQKEGEYYVEKGRKMFKELSQEEKLKKQNLEAYQFIIDPQRSPSENQTQTITSSS